MRDDERAVEAASLAMNSAVEVVDIVAAGGPFAFFAALDVTMRTGERLAVLERGERVVSAPVGHRRLDALNRGEGAVREVFVVVDWRRVVGRKIEPIQRG